MNAKRYTAPGWQPPTGIAPDDELKVMRWLIAKHLDEAKQALVTFMSLTDLTVLLTPEEQRDLLQLLAETWPAAAREALAGIDKHQGGHR